MKKGSLRLPCSRSGAGEESRTLDLNLGKVALYQLSYSRIARLRISAARRGRKYSGIVRAAPARSPHEPTLSA